MFEPIGTDRLLIRPVRADDADALHRRRNHPDVARYETWQLPFPRERTDHIIADVMTMDGPANDEWWMATVADRLDVEILGEVVVRLTWDGRCAEIGYTMEPAVWGRGFATEASSVLVKWLFEELPLTRVHGMLHPDNPASARVLEGVGMLFEGHTRLSFWVGDDNSDDHIYGMTRQEWETWTDRPRHAPHSVELVEIDPDNVSEVLAVRTHKTQERFVRSVVESMADALVPEVVDGQPLVPWFRGVRADGAMVGFVMVAEPTAHLAEPFLWRLIVDRLHQRRGIGGRVLDLVEQQCRSWGADTVVVSWVEGRGSPRRFYEARGFHPTGEIRNGETVARVTLA